MFGSYQTYQYSKSNDVNSSSYLFLPEDELLCFARGNSYSIQRVIPHNLYKLNTYLIKEQEGKSFNYERLQSNCFKGDFYKQRLVSWRMHNVQYIEIF
jgi:hypothetical protein